MYDLERANAQAFADDDLSRFFLKLDNQLDRNPAPRGCRNILDTALHDRQIDGRLVLSNRYVRAAHGRAMIEALLQLYARNRLRFDMRYWLFTATWDLGLTFERRQIVDFRGMTQKVRNTLSRRHLDAICAFDAALFGDIFPGEPGRRLAVHVHGVCWTDNPDFVPTAAANALADTYHNSMGLPGITFRSRLASSARWPGFDLESPEDDQTAASLGYLGYYLTKLKPTVKNRIPTDDGKSYTLESAADLRGYSVLRLNELWSYVTPFEITFGVGDEGSQVRRAYDEHLKAWRDKRGRAKHFLDRDADLRSTYRQYWKSVGHPEFRKPKIII